MPTPPDPEFLALQAAYRAGDQNAATTLYHRFGPAVRHVFRRKIDRTAPGLRPYHDSEVLMLDVMAEFFRRLLTNATFEYPEQLDAFLHDLTHSHFVDTVRKYGRLCRKEPTRRHSLDRAALNSDPRLASPAPSAEDLFQADETLLELLRDQPPHQKSVIILKVRGYSVAQIAKVLGLDERFNRRILDHLHDHPALAHATA